MTVTDLLQDERKAVDLLDELMILKENRLAIEKRESELKDQLKQFMQLNDMRELSDAERGITARLQPRTASPTYDLASAPEHSIVMAAKAMLLKLDATAFKRLRGNNGAMWLDELARYEMPGTESEALIVERQK